MAPGGLGGWGMGVRVELWTWGRGSLGECSVTRVILATLHTTVRAWCNRLTNRLSKPQPQPYFKLQPLTLRVSLGAYSTCRSKSMSMFNVHSHFRFYVPTSHPQSTHPHCHIRQHTHRSGHLKLSGPTQLLSCRGCPDLRSKPNLRHTCAWYCYGVCRSPHILRTYLGRSIM